MERLDSLKDKRLFAWDSDTKDSFLFDQGTESNVRLPVISQERGPRDSESIDVLSLLAVELRRRGFDVTEPTPTKVGQASSLITFPNRKIAVFLAAKRGANRIHFMLTTLVSRSSTARRGSSANVSELETVCGAIKDVLTETWLVDSFQWLSRHQAASTWKELKRKS